MSEISITPTRRLHLFIPRFMRSYEIRCPDCNTRLFDIAERLAGALRIQCRCREHNRERRVWVVIIHLTLQSYVASVKHEGMAIDVKLPEN